MQIFKNRPLALLCCVTSVTAVLAKDLEGALKSWLLLLLLAATLLLFLGYRIGRSCKKLLHYGVFAVLGCSLALFSSYLYFDVYLPKTEEGIGDVHQLEGYVLEREQGSTFSSSFVIKLLTLDGEKCNETVILECEYASPLQCGDYVSLQATQRHFEIFSGYDERESMLANGYTRAFVSENTEGVWILDEKCNALPVKLRQWNSYLSSRLYHTIGGENGALSVALLLGNRTYLSGDTTLQFQRSGVSHLLALSGMHVSVIAALLELLLKRLRLAKLVRAVVIPIVLVGYLMLTGGSPSTVRAVVMVCFLYLAFLLARDYDSLTAVCIVPAALMLITPYAVFDLSLWMSFLAAFSIIVFYPFIRSVGGWIRGREHPAPLLRRAISALVVAICVGMIANAALMLLSSVAFGEFSLASIPATLLLSLPMSALLICSIPALLLPSLPFLNIPCRILSNIMLFTTEKASEMPKILISTDGSIEQSLLWVLTAVLIFLAVAKVGKRFVVYAVPPILMLAIVLCSVIVTSQMPYRILTVEGSDGGVTVYSKAGNAVVVDELGGVGSLSFSISEEASVMRCTEIGDYVLRTYDNQTATFISSLSSRIRIRRIRLSVPRSKRELAIANRVEQEAELHGIEVLYHEEALCVSLDP